MGRFAAAEWRKRKGKGEEGRERGKDKRNEGEGSVPPFLSFAI